MQHESPPFGFNVIGYASANIGLGNTLRQYVHCLLDRGENLCVLDLDAGINRSGHDKSLEKLFFSSHGDLPYAINLLIIGAIELPYLASTPPNGLRVKDRLNVAFVWWELENLPQYLIDAAKVFDVLIAGSDFVYSVLRNNITGIPVLCAPHPLSIPENIRSNRERYQLPEGNFIVFMGFDPYGNIDRKNPFAAIEAFKLALSDRSDCHLVIKVNYLGGGNDVLEANLKQLHTYIESNPRMHLIQENLNYPDLLCLYASCDTFISLHRSEGLGLIPLEAMRLGKPVVATAWSGNMSYMDYNNACLVEYDFVSIEANAQVYGSASLGIESRWAEPNISQAAEWLRKLAEDSQFRSQLGLKAATDATRYHQQASQLDFVNELKVIWENRELLPKRDREKLITQSIESNRHFQYEMYLRKMSPFERFVHKTKKQLDRHLLWRFHKVEA